jgi:hypothetical protein
LGNETGVEGKLAWESVPISKAVALPHAGKDQLILARWDKVTVDISKLRDYCLDPQHPRGKHKARVFEATLGLTSDDAHLLREALLDAVHSREEHMQLGEKDEYGQRHLLDFDLTTDKGMATVRSIWIVLSGETELKLTTCYVK